MKERANWAELLMEFALYKLAYSQFPPSNLSNTTLKMPSIFLYIYILRNCLRRSHDKVLNLQIWRTGSQKLNGPDLLANQVLGDATCAVWNGPDLTSSMGEVHVGNMWAVFGPWPCFHDFNFLWAPSNDIFCFITSASFFFLFPSLLRKVRTVSFKFHMLHVLQLSFWVNRYTATSWLGLCGKHLTKREVYIKY